MTDETRLWKYVEGRCTPAEKAAVEADLANDPALRKELELIKRLHRALSETPVEKPSPAFTAKVMHRVCRTPQLQPLVDFRRLGLLGATWLLFMSLIIWVLHQRAVPEPSPFYRSLSDWLERLPKNTMEFIVIFVITMGLLAFMDAIFSKWHRRKAQAA